MIFHPVFSKMVHLLQQVILHVVNLSFIPGVISDDPSVQEVTKHMLIIIDLFQLYALFPKCLRELYMTKLSLILRTGVCFISFSQALEVVLT
jgi:hypothetical protein